MSADAPLRTGINSVLRRFPQATFALRLVSFLQQMSQGREKFLLQIVYAAPVELVSLSILADGQPLHKPLLEVVPVFRQHCFHGVVQKL